MATTCRRKVMKHFVKQLATSPFWDLDWIDREFNRFIEPLQSAHGARINVYNKDGEAKVLVSLPGWKPEWFDISIENNKLHIKGQSQFEGPEERNLRLERTVNLPFRIDRDQVEAAYTNGLLNIDIKRAAEDAPRKITVNVA